MRSTMVAAGIVLALLAGCGNSDSEVEATQPTTTPSSGDQVLRCGHHEVPLERLTSPRPATALPQPSKQALRLHAPKSFDLSDYTIVDNAPDFASIIGTVPLDKRRSHPPGTYEYRAAKYIAPEPGKPRAWMLWSAGSCALKHQLGDLSDAGVSLDRDALPRPGDRNVQLQVLEFACASGQPATGRIQVPVLEMTADQVRVAIGVEPREGGQDCQGNPVTPFTLDLPEPFGARKLIDVSAYPEREITVAKDAR